MSELAVPQSSEDDESNNERPLRYVRKGAWKQEFCVQPTDRRKLEKKTTSRIHDVIRKFVLP